jgi:uncharacterized protein YjdB
MFATLIQRIQLPLAAAVISLSCGGDEGTGPEAVLIATVEISPPSARILPGGTVQLAAALKDAAGNNVADRSVSWSTSNAAVASVSEAGLVIGMAEGEVVVTATSEGKRGAAAITVYMPLALVEPARPSPRR